MAELEGGQEDPFGEGIFLPTLQFGGDTSMDVQSSYDRVAEEYVRRFFAELERKPFDRVMLNWLAERTAGRGLICDLGCGPGQIARYLKGRGAPVCGVDLSAEMVAHARRLSPEIAFEQGDMRDLYQVADQAFAAIVAFHSLIHLTADEIPATLKELRRLLKPDGVLLIAFHLGSEVRHLVDWLGQSVSLDFVFFEREDMMRYLADAGFVVSEAIERDPYPDIEVQTRRAYLFAVRK